MMVDAPFTPTRDLLRIPSYIAVAKRGLEAMSQASRYFRAAPREINRPVSKKEGLSPLPFESTDLLLPAVHSFLQFRAGREFGCSCRGNLDCQAGLGIAPCPR